MKNLLFLAVMALFLFACNNTESKDSAEVGNSENEKSEEQTKTNSDDKKYEIETGSITYKMNMMGMDTKTTMVFKDFGQTESSVIEMEMMGKKTITKTLRTGDFYYQYSLEQKTGTKIKMDKEAMAAEGEMGKLDEKNIEEMGGKKVGSEKILGKECTVFELEVDNTKSKFWIWKSMVFKMVASQNGMEMTMEAIEFSDSPSFPSGTFDVPSDVKFTEPEMDANFDDIEAQG